MVVLPVLLCVTEKFCTGLTSTLPTATEGHIRAEKLPVLEEGGAAGRIGTVRLAELAVHISMRGKAGIEKVTASEREGLRVFFEKI